MPIITEVKQQKRQNRVSVWLDGKFGFGIDLENFVLERLKVGQEISEEKVEEVVKKAEFQKTYEKLLKFAMMRPRSEKEIGDWFYRKKVHESIQEDLKNKLVNLQLLDDAKFAKWWVEQRNAFKPRSIRLLKMELQQKGVDRNIVEDVFSENSPNEFEAALKLAEKKGRLDNDKLTGYLFRKGFSWETIQEVLSALQRE